MSASEIFKAAMKIAVERNDFTELTIAIAQSENPIKSATAVVGAMAAVIEAVKGPRATSQLFEALAAVSAVKSGIPQ